MSSLTNMADLLKESGINFSEEAIDFQINTKFADSIRDVYADIMAYRETCRGDKRIVTKVIDYATKQMNAQFPKIWKDNIGLKLEKIVLTNNISFFFAMQPRLGNDKTMAKIIDSMTGNNLYAGSIDFSNKTYEELKKISMSFDTKTGSLGLKKFMGQDIGMNFFFDPYVAFLTKDTLNVNFDYFTPEELTAITLHEVGHMMSMVEHCGDMFYRLAIRASLIKGFVKSAPFAEKLKFIRDILNDPAAVKYMAANSVMPTKLVEGLLKATKNVVDSFDQHRNDNKNDSSIAFWSTIINFLINAVIIAFICAAAIYAPFQFLVVGLLSQLGISFTRDFTEKGGLNDPKYSDFMANKTTSFQWERWADEYVTRYGYGSHLSSGLNRLFTMMNSSNILASNQKGTDTWIRNSWIPLTLNYTIMLFWNIVGGGNMEDGCGTYECHIDRLKRVIQDMSNAFKRMDLPPEVMDVYIHEYESCINQLNNVPMSKKCEHMYALVHRCVMSFIDPIQLGNRLLRGNIKAEYAQLANDIDDLQSNPLFYNASKLQSIINKR